MGVKNDFFLSEIGSAFGEPGGTPPPRIPRSTPPGNIGGIDGIVIRLSRLSNHQGGKGGYLSLITLTFLVVFTHHGEN